VAQVIAFELDYVESIEENAIVIVPIRRPEEKRDSFLFDTQPSTLNFEGA